MSNLFHGKLVRLAAPNPDTDPELMARWSRDSSYLRLLDSDPAVPRSKRSFKENMEREPRENSFFFMIHTLAEDKPIGFIGLWGVRWRDRDTYVGIGLGEREYWGKGYGTDAMRIVLRFAFQELDLFRVSLSVFGYNQRAMRSYEKVGFQYEGTNREFIRRDGAYYDVMNMGILRQEWEEKNTVASAEPEASSAGSS